MDIEYEKRIALALMSLILDLSSPIYESVDNLFRKLGVGGGFLWNRSLSGDIAKQTRYEIISYLVSVRERHRPYWARVFSFSSS